MTECSPSIVSAGCFAPLPPLVRLSAPVAASSPVALVRVRVRVRVRLRVRVWVAFRVRFRVRVS